MTIKDGIYYSQEFDDIVLVYYSNEVWVSVEFYSLLRKRIVKLSLPIKAFNESKGIYLGRL